MSNRELTYSEFEKMFLNDDIKGLKSALGRTHDKFIFQDLLYAKIVKNKDKEKAKKYINTGILGAEYDLQLIVSVFDENEITEILLENMPTIVGNLEVIFLESKINSVEVLCRAIEKYEGMTDYFFEKITMMSPKSQDKIKKVLDFIGKEKIKRYIEISDNSDIIKTILVMYDDIDFVEECIFDENLDISEYTKMRILQAFKEKSQPIYHKCLERYQMFVPGYILDCLEQIGDKELSIEYLCNDNIDFTEEDKIWFIWEFKDIDFVKRCLREERLNLASMGKVVLICEIGDKEYAEKCIEDATLGLEEQDIIFLKTFFEIGLEEYIETIKDTRTMLKTPKDSTKGIEIESGGGLNEYVIEIINVDEDIAEKIKLDQKWKYVKDGSGIELSSYVMTDDEQATNSIYYICHILKEQGHKTTEKDAAHVHIGTNILTNVQSYKNLLEMWYNLEKAMFLVSNREGELPRKEAITGERYAEPRSKRLNFLIKSGEIGFRQNETIQQFIYKLKMEFDKHSSVNLGNVGRELGSTLEYRVANGTLEPEIWIQNINFFATFTQSAEDLYQIQAKAEEERTEKEKRKLQLFQTIKSKEVSEAEKFESLLGIMLEDEEQRSIYRKRYIANSKLLEQEENQELKIKLEEQVADYFIGFDPIEIGEHCFEETGAELEEAARNRLQRDKDRGKYRGTEFLSQ